jgi:hypothetical protein
VPTQFGHHQVLLKGYVHSVEIVCGNQVIARHERSYERETAIYDPLHYRPCSNTSAALWIRPLRSAARNCRSPSPFSPAPMDPSYSALDTYGVCGKLKIRRRQLHGGFNFPSRHHS